MKNKEQVIKCPNCGSENVCDYEDPLDVDDELYIGDLYSHTCEDCGHNF